MENYLRKHHLRFAQTQQINQQICISLGKFKNHIGFLVDGIEVSEGTQPTLSVHVRELDQFGTIHRKRSRAVYAR
jgi:hypothetical protein